MDAIKSQILSSKNRLELWNLFLKDNKCKKILEVGVFRGDFAAYILKNHPYIKKYYMLDPWRHLENWNKPANVGDDKFDQYYREVIEKTDFCRKKRIVLKGRTVEMIDQISDKSLDFAYIDGDHTLRGISIDMMTVFPKIKNEGYIAGDDFVSNIWQHGDKFEPTLIFPFAVYFAEATGSIIYALPHNQFILQKKKKKKFQFIDWTGRYNNPYLRDQFISN